jgi:hypothetical protein
MLIGAIVSSNGETLNILRNLSRTEPVEQNTGYPGNDSLATFALVSVPSNHSLRTVYMHKKCRVPQRKSMISEMNSK